MGHFDYLFCESQSPLHENWAARDEHGQMKTVKFISGMAHKRALTDEELNQLHNLKFIRHPRLVPVEEVEIEQGKATLVSPRHEATLLERFKTCIANGLPGIPRAEMLDYLRSIAEGLDFLCAQQQYLHLTLNPGNIVFMSGRIKVIDYALAQLIWLPVGQTLDLNVLRYASTEVLEGQYASNSDQFSLALLFIELTTGKFPVPGHTIRQWRDYRRAGKVNLDLATIEDAPVLSKALSNDPARRYDSLSHFVDALGHIHKSSTVTQIRRQPVRIESDSILVNNDGIPLFSPGMVESIVHQLVQMSAYKTVENFEQGIRFQVEDNGDVIHKCAAWLPQGLAHGKLLGFANEWKAQEVSATEEDFHYRCELPRSMWKKLTNQTPESIDILVNLTPPVDVHTKLTEVTIRIHYVGPNFLKGKEYIEKVCPAILYTLRTFLLATSEARIRERYRFDQPMLIYPLIASRLGEPLRVFGKDISMTGLGVVGNSDIESTTGFLHAKHDSLGSLVLPIKKARSSKLSNGMYEIGFTFES